MTAALSPAGTDSFETAEIAGLRFPRRRLISGIPPLERLGNISSRPDTADIYVKPGNLGQCRFQPRGFLPLGFDFGGYNPALLTLAGDLLLEFPQLLLQHHNALLQC